jgi:hypothetical protein
MLAFQDACMTDLAILQRELKAMNHIQEQLTAIAQRRDQERKIEMVKLRRMLADQIGVVAQAGRTALPDQDVHNEFRSRLSVMRSAIALHQAEWPAVKLDNAPEEYSRSAKRVQKARDDFLGWVLPTIDGLSGRKPAAG